MLIWSVFLILLSASIQTVQSFSAATFRHLVAQKNANRDTNMNASQAIENLLDNAGDKTLVEIHNELDEIVKHLDPETQRQHYEWKKRIDAEERARMERIRDALPHLSQLAQQKLIRIVLIQQNDRITQSEKRQTLGHLATTMNADVVNELLDRLSQDDLFFLHLSYKK